MSRSGVDALYDQIRQVKAENEQLREALKQARYFVSKHDMKGHVLATVDGALWAASDMAAKDRS